MRLAGLVFGVVLGLVAALCVSGCQPAIEPYTPAGADGLWQPEPAPDLFGDAATVVTDIAIENQADAAVVVVRTSGAPPQVRAHQRYEPTHVALDIQAARLGIQQQPVVPSDPGGTVSKVVAVERLRNLKPQVVIRVHLHEAVPFEVEQDEGVIRLALARRPPDTGAAGSPAPVLEADAAPSEQEAAVEPPLAETTEERPTPETPVEPTLPEAAAELVTPDAVADLPESEATPEPPASEPADAPDEPASSEAAADPPASETGEATEEPATPDTVAERPAAEAALEPPPSEPADEPAAPSSAPSEQIISLDVQEADLHDVLRLIADAVGVNVIAGTDVQGSVTTRLENVPWNEALDAVLSINGMGYERSGNVIRIAPLEHFAKAREARLREQEAQRQIQPIFTQVVTINYANAAALQANLEKLLSDRGSLAVDARTNTIIVNDTRAAIDTITGLVTTLDRPTPQIMIESRIVETSRNFLRELGVQLAGRGREKVNASFPSSVSVFGGGSRAGSDVPGNFLLDLPAQVGTGAGGSLGISFASLGSSFLDVQLSALEATGRGKVISRPRIATLDNTEALIQSGRRIPFETTSANQGTRTQFADASISLRVTPHVTPHGFINMKILASRNAADFTRTSRDGVPTIITREATTEMLVRDGDTVVIGGLYTRDTSVSQDGVPFFSKIPGLGWLFRRTRNSDTTDELLFFITPRIIREPQESLETS